MADAAAAGVTSLEFAAWVRTIAVHYRAMGLGDPPGFRCPPRRPGVTRTYRRTPTGAVVAVAIAGRTQREVLLDLLAGAVLAAGLMPNGSPAGELRRRVIADTGVDVTPPDELDDDA